MIRHPTTVNESVEYTTIRIEQWNEGVEEPAVAQLVLAKRRPGNQIRKLDHPRCRRVHKERNLSQISKMPPARPVYPEGPRQHLKGALVDGLVHHNQAPLLIPSSVINSRQKEIKATAKFFKRNFHCVPRTYDLLIYCDRE